jgi:hypothetical protein
VYRLLDSCQCDAIFLSYGEGGARPHNHGAALQVGLHQAALRCLPLFLLYLVTLMHTYSLAYLQVRHVCQSAADDGRWAPNVAVFQLHLHL